MTSLKKKALRFSETLGIIFTLHQQRNTPEYPNFRKHRCEENNNNNNNNNNSSLLQLSFESVALDVAGSTHRHCFLGFWLGHDSQKHHLKARAK
jgi:hypothetical protein